MYYNSQDIEDFKGWITDHIHVSVSKERTRDMPDGFPCGNYIFAEVDDYRPDDDQPWDPEAWEARNGYLYYALDIDPKTAWLNCYRMARALSRLGGVDVRIRSTGEVVRIELPCITHIYRN